MFWFGKWLPEESITGGLISSTLNMTPPNNFAQKPLLDYINFHAQGDNRSYLQIEILGVAM